MVNKEFFSALDALEKERRISKESLIESLEAGMISAFKKEYGETRNISVNIDEAKHSIKVYSYRTVVENDDVVEDYDKEITLEEAREIKPSYNVGDTVIEEIPPEEFSRIAAQTAKQVILQRLNDIKKAYETGRGSIKNASCCKY